MQQQPIQPVQPQPSGRFTQKNTNQDDTAVSNDPVAKIKQLKEMLDLGAISQAEFDIKKQEILRSNIKFFLSGQNL